MADWNKDYGLGVTMQGFYAGGKIYAAGAHKHWVLSTRPSLNMVDNIAGRGGIYLIDPMTMVVDMFFPTGISKPGKFPLNASGQVLPLGGNATSAPGAKFKIVGLSNTIFNLISVDSDLAASSLKNHGSVSKKAGEVIDQRFFKINDLPAVDASVDPALKKSNTYVLYCTNKGQLKHRNLDIKTGKPIGVSKTVLKIKKRRLKYMDVVTYGKDVLLAFSEQKNKKKHLIYFYKFSVN